MQFRVLWPGNEDVISEQGLFTSGVGEFDSQMHLSLASTLACFRLSVTVFHR